MPIWSRLLRGLRAAPVVVWIAAFTLVPNLILVVYSFWSSTLGMIDRTPTVENYLDVFGSATTRFLLLRTLGIAALAAAIAVVIGFMMAYIVTRHFPRWKLPITVLVIIPLWISFLMRVFAWKVILGEQGVLNSFLMATGIVQEPVSVFLYSTFSLMIGLVYVGIPYAYLGAYVTLDRIPSRLYEAAGDLGAGGFRAFRDLVWPIGRPAIGLGFTLVFIIVYGDYVTPQLLGGFEGTMIGVQIVQAFGQLNNWPLGATLALVTLVSGLLVVGIVTLVTRNKVVLED